MGETLTVSSNLDSSPVVFTRAGVVYASSRDVAELFEKRHDHVLRDIDGLISADPRCAPNFGETSAIAQMPNGGQRSVRAFDITRDGFTLLAMGFNGQKALQFKLAYIDAFNRMDESLRANVITRESLDDPRTLRSLLLSYDEKVLALTEENEKLVVKERELDRIAAADGSFCITDAAKTLQSRPKDLFSFLRSHGWIYSRQSGDEVAYQSKLANGLLEHKTTTVHRSDGSERVTTQVRVTPRGLVRLAAEFQPIARMA